MIRPSDKTSPLGGTAGYEKDQAEFLMNLVKISECVCTLSNMVAPDDDERCREFKRRQLHHLLGGNLLQMNESRTSEIAEKMLHWPEKTASHLGILSARDIGCHYPKLTDESNVSVLDLHSHSNSNIGNNWCNNCLHIGRLHEPKFELGTINPFSCWRRGHQSGKLGFVQFCELSSSGKGVEFRAGKLYASNLLKSLIHHHNSKISLDLSTDNLSKYHSMIAMITLNPQKRDETNRLSEIRQILPKQLLVSRHITEKQTNSSHYLTEGEKKDPIPEILSNLLEEINAMWRLRGPSKKDTKGIIGVALLNNSSPYADNESLQNHLQLFAEEHKIWYEKFEMDKLPEGLLTSLQITKENIPINQCLLCVIFDPIINLGRES
tara:strand:+ start:29 stop:1165 length:1137 start_codon:yes stop_codon:yes gene_type:complete